MLRLGPEHGAAVLEMGMYVGGEIADLAAIGRPSIGVVTAVQPVHLSRIGTLEAVEQAKGELLEALPADGTGGPQRRRPGRHPRWTVGPPHGSCATASHADADVRADGVSSVGFDGMRFRLVTPVGERIVTIPTLGRLSVHNALAAAAVGSPRASTSTRIVGRPAGRLERAPSHRDRPAARGDRHR